METTVTYTGMVNLITILGALVIAQMVVNTVLSVLLFFATTGRRDRDRGPRPAGAQAEQTQALPAPPAVSYTPATVAVPGTDLVPVPDRHPVRVTR